MENSSAKNKVNPHKQHRMRMRERYYATGLDSFADHEVLEMLLYNTILIRDTNGIAHDLIERFGSLAGVLDSTPEELREVPAVGEQTVAFLTMLPDIFRRYQLERQGVHPKLNTRFAAGEYVSALFIGSSYESFYLICLNLQKEVVRTVEVSRGSLSSTAVPPRLVVETALRFHSHSVILAHNHPSGNTHPSSADVALTDTLVDALSAINIQVTDHIIACGADFVSFSELGLLPDRY